MVVSFGDPRGLTRLNSRLYINTGLRFMTAKDTEQKQQEKMYQWSPERSNIGFCCPLSAATQEFSLSANCGHLWNVSAHRSPLEPQGLRLLWEAVHVCILCYGIGYGNQNSGAQ